MTAIPTRGHWVLHGDTVTGWLDTTHTRLKANGFTHTAVMDQVVRAYHRNGAAIEVIWSRRRADDSEIERLAVHFEVIRTERGWRMAGYPTPANPRRHLARGLGLDRRPESAMRPPWSRNAAGTVTVRRPLASRRTTRCGGPNPELLSAPG